MWLLLTLFLLQVRGLVVEQESRAPVIGAAVSDIRKRFGTYTDINGGFTLPKAQVGDTLVVEHLGYLPETLVVRAAFITVYLRRSVIPLEPVTVVEKALEERLKVTGTLYVRRGGELEISGWEAPWEGIQTYPGVIQGHIRGGRRDEALYTLDGAPIIDNTQRKLVFDLPAWAISEMQLQTSGFEPEYGDLTSGLILLNSKKMGLKRQRYLHFRGDLTAPPFGDPYREFQLGGFFSGPQGFLSLRATASGGRFWKDWRTVFPYPVDKRLDFLGNWTHPLREGFLLLQGLGYLREWREFENLWRYYPQGLPLRRRESHRYGLILSNKLNERLGLDLSLFAYILNYQVLGKPTREYNLNFVFDSLGFVREGDKPVWADRFQKRWFLKGKLHFFGSATQGYIGGEASFYDLYVREVQLYPQYMPGYRFTAFLTYVNRYHYRPRSFALFASLKYKEGGELIHLGLRYDAFDPRSYRPAVELPHRWPPPDWVYEPQDSVPARVKHQLSPRFGFSHRTANLIIRFNYGEFFQVPQFQYLYSNPFYNFHRGYLPLVGNPDLKPSRTRQYEYGVIWVPDSVQNVSVNLFRRESSNLVDAIRIMPDTAVFTDLTTGFTLYEDVGTADAVGLELSWEGSRPGLRWTLSYTLMRAMGTYGTWLENPASVEGVTLVPGERYPLSWDQTHTVAAEITWGDPNHRFLSLYLKWGSGLPYTPRGGPPNSRRLPPNFESRVQIGTRVKGFRLHLRISNPTDHRHILWVDGDGRPGGRLADPLAYSEGRRIWVELARSF